LIHLSAIIVTLASTSFTLVKPRSGFVNASGPN